MRVLQLGLGRRGRNVLRNLVRLYLEGLVEEIFIYDPVAELVERSLKAYRVAKPGSPEDDYDAVFIVTPPGTHYELAKRYLSRGIAAFIEKPPALSVEELDELASLGKASADMLLRYTPAAEYLSRSSPKFVEATRATIPSSSVDVSVVRDVMIHDVDLAFYLYGKRSLRRASRIYDLEGFPSPAAAEAYFDGFRAKALRTRKPVRVRERRLYYDDRVEIVDTSSNVVRVISDGISEFTLPGEEPLYASIKDFVLYVSGEKKPRNELSTVRDAVAACAEIEDATRA